jgi:hypothetical protein
MLEPTQESPNSNPEPTLSRQRADMLLERREYIDTSRDRNHTGGERAVRPIQRIHGDTHECPDGKVRPDEQRHGAHPTAV